MLQLERLTTEYIPLEDRILLSGQISEHQTVKIWLTQRMVRLLIPHLLDWLQNKPGSRGKSTAHRGSSLRDIVQSFEQEVAIANLADQDQTPVITNQEDHNLLIQSIDITTGDKAIQIGFKSETIQEELKLINLIMEIEPLRQWLHILYAQTSDGGWSLHCWPEWMTDMGRDATKTEHLGH